MASLDQHGLGPEVADRPRRGLHRPDVPDREAGEPLRFVAVRGHEGRAIEEAFDEGRSEIVLLEPRADGRDHHRVDDDGERGAPQAVRDRPDDVCGVQHPGLRRPHIEVVQDRAQLFPNFRGRDREDRIDRARVLGRHARDDTRPVHADRRERLQVRLNSRAAPGVAPGDRQGRAHLRAKEGAGLKSDARHVGSVVSGTPSSSARLIGTEVRARSGHIKFDKKVRWKNLVSAFRPLFLKFLEETQQLPEDMESLDVLVEENLRDLRSNRKPEAYNREGVMRMMFPISNEVEFYVYGRGKALEVARVTEALSRVLQKYRLKHTIEWDQLKLLAGKKE